MNPRYLLYIDVLGFSDMVTTAPARVDDLYAVIASLNAHRHGDFATIVFSDTILVHNVPIPSNEDEHSYLVMYLCEFVQDFLHRTALRDFAIRALLTYGEFEHYVRGSVPCYYGQGLIDAYRAEKTIKCTGLFLDRHCQRRNRIFSMAPLNSDLAFTFVTQALDEWEDVYGAPLPIPDIIGIESDLCGLLGPELLMLKQYHRHATRHPDLAVRQKFVATLAFYRARYPKAFAALENRDFNVRLLSRHYDWAALEERLKQDFEWASTKQAPRTASMVRRPGA